MLFYTMHIALSWLGFVWSQFVYESQQIPKIRRNSRKHWSPPYSPASTFCPLTDQACNSLLDYAPYRKRVSRSTAAKALIDRVDAISESLVPLRSSNMLPGAQFRRVDTGGMREQAKTGKHMEVEAATKGEEKEITTSF